MDPDSRKTLDQALKGKTIVIPGILNQVLRWIGGLIPPALLSRMLGKRWRSARKNRADLEIVRRNSQHQPRLRLSHYRKRFDIFSIGMGKRDERLLKNLLEPGLD